MKFNRDMCKVIYLGGGNRRHSYMMRDAWLVNTMSEEDLGTVVDHKLNVNQ